MPSEDKTRNVRNECLEAARQYLSYGWSPIAIRERSKKPAGVDGQGRWEEFQKRRAKPEELERSWQVTPDANVGVVMGQISGIIGIDVDGVEGDVELYELSSGVQPKTITFNTGRDDSYRYIYKLPMGHPCPSVVISNNLKILGNGSQSVMPPSVHPEGDKYSWVVERQPVECPLADAPPWLLTILSQHSTEGRRQGHKDNSNMPRFVGDGETIMEGGRESTLVTIAGAMRRFGATKYEMYEALKAINVRCDPPLPDHDLQRIARSVSNYAPQVVPPTPQLIQRASVLPKLNVIQMDQVIEEKLNWLWPGWLPLGTMVCVDGDGGVGKSTMLLDLAARITRGDVMPDGVKPDGFTGPQNVMIIACEDILTKVMKPKVIAARADESRVFYVETANDIAIKKSRQMEFPADAESLAEEVKTKNIKFLYIDPILAFMGGSNDYARDQDVRLVLAPLKAIAEINDCCIVYLRHWNKGGAGGKASYRGGGSLAFVNAARCGLIVGKNPDNEAQSILAFAKGNLSKPPASLVFETIQVPNKQGICFTNWLGASKHTANDVARSSDDNTGVDSTTAVGDATQFLRETLRKGKIPVKQIQKDAKDAGIAWMTVRRAKDDLGVESVKEPNQWCWALPSKPKVTPNANPTKETAKTTANKGKDESQALEVAVTHRPTAQEGGEGST